MPSRDTDQPAAPRPCRLQLVDADTGEVIVARLQLADTFWLRFRGWQFRRSAAPQEGLLLRPCRSIHTHWMRFPIDVVMLDSDNRVLAVHSSVPPWRLVPRAKGTRSVVEAAARAMAPRTHVGARLEVVHVIA